MNELIKNRLEIEVKIEAVWKGGNVVIAKLGSAGEKKKVMMRKNKLGGTNIFIENDLNYESRKKQEEIARWVRLRGEGWNARIGIGKVFIDKSWIKWEDKKVVKEIEDRNRLEKNSNVKKRRVEQIGGWGEGRYSEELMQSLFG